MIIITNNEVKNKMKQTQEEKMKRMKITTNRFQCTRCSHVWISRVEQPVSCPKCKSPSWNKPRKKARTK